MKHVAATFLALTLAASPAFAAKINGTVSTKNVKKENYADAATVTLEDAIGAALENSPGKAIEAELDEENGFLVYEVKIVGADKKKTEVLVDAGNKSVLHTEKK
jgi:uncharacterized membrane protein YkoI